MAQPSPFPLRLAGANVDVGVAVGGTTVLDPVGVAVDPGLCVNVGVPPVWPFVGVRVGVDVPTGVVLVGVAVLTPFVGVSVGMGVSVTVGVNSVGSTIRPGITTT